MRNNCQKGRMKIPKGLPEAVNRKKRTENIIPKQYFVIDMVSCISNSS